MFRRLVLATAAISLGVCAPSQAGPSTVRYADEAGSTLVTVMSITPWESVKADLQPKFPLTETEALAKVIPSTALSQRRALDIVALTLQAATPTASKKTTASSKTDTEGVTTSSSQTDTTRASGDASLAPKIDLLAGGAPALAGAPDSWVATGSDPMLTYLAAAALKQEAALISRYIEDAAIAKDARAFVVRLQVSNLPLRRNLPYDVYTNISFLDGALTAPFAAGTKAQGGGACRDLSVMPLLVTDNLEGILSSDSQENVRQLGLSLLAMLNATGLSASARKTADDLEQRLGKDLNSLFTVGRLSNDTVRVRFGASANTAAKWAMIPRTQNVSLVVVATPCAGETAARTVTAVSRTDYIHAINGKPLPQRPRSQYASWFKDVLKTYNLAPKGVSDTAVAELILSATDGRWEEFRTEAKKINGLALDEDLSRAAIVGLYSDLAAWKRINRFSYTSMQLDMAVPLAVLPPRDQTILLAVGKAAVTAKLQQGAGLANSKLGAVLVSNNVRVPATAVTTSAGGATVEANFPPLADYGLAGGGAGEIELFSLTSNDIFEIRKDGTFSVNAASPARYKGVAFTAPPPETPADPPFTLKLAGDMVLSSPTGEGQLAVRAAKADGKAGPVYLAVSGADLVAVTSLVGTPLASTDGRWQIASAGSANLSLRNLAPGRKLEISLQDDKGKAVGGVQTIWVLASNGDKKD